MTETPGAYDTGNSGSQPQKRQRLPVTRTIQAKLLIEARAVVNIDEVIDALGPGIKVLGMSTNYRQPSGDSVLRHVTIETVPDNKLQTEHRAEVERLEQRIRQLEAKG